MCRDVMLKMRALASSEPNAGEEARLPILRISWPGESMATFDLSHARAHDKRACHVTFDSISVTFFPLTIVAGLQEMLKAGATDCGAAQCDCSRTDFLTQRVNSPIRMRLAFDRGCQTPVTDGHQPPSSLAGLT